jgi:glycosyltransferase involved in cell wall biosynthesis
MQQVKSPATSIIISVYKDSTALNLILKALQLQSRKDFEIIISEDGRCNTIRELANTWSSRHDAIYHLIQDDIGFRKNRALNRAIAFCNADHLIFIDGDCIPHPLFIEAHQTYMGAGRASAGRRAELGPLVSSDIRSGKLMFKLLFNKLSYLMLLPRLLADNINHIGQGMSLKMLQRLTANRHIRILGCNFSCHKQDLYRINGFNEDFIAAGWGEDSDIEWRLKHIGVKIYNTKFSAIQYHLHHERWYTLDDKNRKILKDSIQNKTSFCKHGLSQHDTITEK